jgi:hypothetical protein
MMALRILPTLSEAFTEVGRRWRVFFRVLILPSLLLGVAATTEEAFEQLFWVALVLKPFQLLLGTMCAVSCHRLVLIGDEGIPNSSGLFLSARELRFIGWSLALGLIFAAFVVFSALLGIALVVVLSAAPRTFTQVLVGATLASCLVLALYVCGRCSLIFPATAIDRRASLRSAWTLSEGNGWRLMLLIILGSCPATALALVWVSVGPPPGGQMIGVLFNTGAVLLGAFGVATLSVIYGTLADSEVLSDAT